MLKEKYNFIAILSYDDDGISVEFPDIEGCFSYGETTDDTITSAKEALALHLYGMEQDDDIIPEPSDIKNIKLEKCQVPVMIDVFMPPFRDKMDSKYVKKTLSIPNWLNIKAEREGVNFSKVLQNALVSYLHIEQK